MATATDNGAGSAATVTGRTTTTGGLTWAQLATADYRTDGFGKIVKISTGGHDHAVLDCGGTVQDISAKCTHVTPGMTCRVVDDQNYFISYWYNTTGSGGGLYVCVAGTFTQLGATHAGFVDGDVLGIRVNSSNVVESYKGVGGAALASVTNSTGATATKAGIRGDTGVATVSWDDISLTYTAAAAAGGLPVRRPPRLTYR